MPEIAGYVDTDPLFNTDSLSDFEYSSSDYETGYIAQRYVLLNSFQRFIYYPTYISYFYNNNNTNQIDSSQ